MGQKTHPYGLRLGVIKSWKSRWFTTKNFAELLHEDILIRRYTNKRLEHAGIADIQILRAPKKVTIDIHTARPGIVIGRKGAEVDKLKEELQLLTGKEILLNIIEVKKPELNATLVAQSIARQLEGRVSFRRAMKKSVAASMKSGAEGIKIMCSGRLGGAEIARSEKYHQGRVPLHTLRADIDYATATAHTTYGTIGVKVWICKGEILEKEKVEAKLLGETFVEKDERKGKTADSKPRRRRASQVERRRRPEGIRKPSAKALDKSKKNQKGGGRFRPRTGFEEKAETDKVKRSKPVKGQAESRSSGKPKMKMRSKTQKSGPTNDKNLEKHQSSSESENK
ncbi:MAG: 30S ribosomal protein S3 [candidate division Zixibacteria bacterium 4484_95]|nr:MAG: 30S ribosomal protein S3 [candidate division Zixibacteria bacterium 4484_95]